MRVNEKKIASGDRLESREENFSHRERGRKRERERERERSSGLGVLFLDPFSRFDRYLTSRSVNES